MALPWEDTADVDTLALIATNTIGSDPIAIINDAGERMLYEFARRGRIRVVNDSEFTEEPLLYQDGGSPIIDFLPDDFAGTNMTATAKEILTAARFSMVVSSRNIAFPQAMPAGNRIGYLENLTKSSMIGVVQREEARFVRGADTKTGAYARSAVYNGGGASAPRDADFTTKRMSVPGLFLSGTGYISNGVTIPDTESFAGITGADSPRWIPQQFKATAANGSNLLPDMEKMAKQAWFNEQESGDMWWTNQDVYHEITKQLRSYAALPQPIPTDLASSPNLRLMVAGIPVDWSDFLTADGIWDGTSVAPATPNDCHPVLLFNYKSLRMDLVMSGTVQTAPGANPKDRALTFIEKVGDVQNMESTNQRYWRIQWKHQYSLEKGRRSFAYMADLTLA